MKNTEATPTTITEELNEEFRFPMCSSKEHVDEIDNYVHIQKQSGRRGRNGRPYTRTDYVNDALEHYAKITGLKTSPYR
jgi:hypothetical protein